MSGTTELVTGVPERPLLEKVSMVIPLFPADADNDGPLSSGTGSKATSTHDLILNLSGDGGTIAWLQPSSLKIS